MSPTPGVLHISVLKIIRMTLPHKNMTNVWLKKSTLTKIANCFVIIVLPFLTNKSRTHFAKQKMVTLYVESLMDSCDDGEDLMAALL